MLYAFSPFFLQQIVFHYALPLIIANPYNIYFRLLNHMPVYFPQDKRESLKFKEL